MFWTKFRMKWHYVWYKIYDSIAEFYLGLENVRLIFESNMFWTVSDRFEKYLRKASQAHFYYITEWRSMRGLPVN
jgi:hypothetical protein